tara:strand:+ start:791 stop:901 length:111 start_codon:yes stop_codon:yes gene_type:complete
MEFANINQNNEKKKNSSIGYDTKMEFPALDKNYEDY